MSRGVHKLVLKTAQEMAGAYYEHTAGQIPGFYKQWPNVNVYIRSRWQNFVPIARDILASMLGSPSTTEHIKAEIYQALIYDRVVSGQQKPKKLFLH